MASEQSTSAMPFIPPEIRLHILEGLDLSNMSFSELALVWTNLRSVSKAFRTKIEALFAERVLPEVKLCIFPGSNPKDELSTRAFRSSGAGTGWGNYLQAHRSLRGSSFPPEFMLEYLREDGEMVYLIRSKAVDEKLPDPVKQYREVYWSQMFKPLERTEDANIEYEVAHHYVTKLSQMYTDIVIPNVVYSPDETTISFNWRSLFSEIFSEEMVAMKLSSQPEQVIEGLLREDRELLQNKEVNVRFCLRSRRFRNWFKRQYRDITLEVQHANCEDRDAFADRLLVEALKSYDERFEYMSFRSDNSLGSL